MLMRAPAIWQKSGERLRYFEDDDRASLADLVAQEKRGGSGSDPDALYARLARRGHISRTDDDEYTMDDMFTEKAGRSMPAGREAERDRNAAIRGKCSSKIPRHTGT
jgi:hypothetical protein